MLYSVAIELDYDTAYQAYKNISLQPEAKARQIIEGFQASLALIHGDIFALAETPEQRRIAEQEFEQFARQYKEKYERVLRTRSGTANAYITGRTKFNYRRNQRALETEQKREQEMNDWRVCVINAMKRTVLAARTTEQLERDDWQDLKTQINEALAIIQAADTGQSIYDRQIFANRIAKATKRFAEKGCVEIVEKAVGLVRAYNEQHKKPVFTPRHRFWKLIEKAKEARVMTDETDKMAGCL